MKKQIKTEKDWLLYKEAWKYIGCGKTKFFELIKAQYIVTRQIGNICLAKRESVENYLSLKPKRREYLELIYGRN